MEPPYPTLYIRNMGKTSLTGSLNYCLRATASK